VTVWTPATKVLVNGASLHCYPGSGSVPEAYSVGVAGARVAYSALAGGNTTLWSVEGFVIDPTFQSFLLASGSNTCCLWPPQVAGAGDLLVFATRRISYGPPTTTVWELRRIGPLGCDCPLLSRFEQAVQEPVALDTDGSHILIARSQSVEVLASDGSKLLGISNLPGASDPVRPAIEAGISGDDLVVRAGAELRVYKLESATLERHWALAGVSPLPRPRVLEDVATGLAAYVRGTEIHVLRLANGSDRLVGHGTVATFMSDGLVYADGSRLHLVPSRELIR
jgi:hypothetical protein